MKTRYKVLLVVLALIMVVTVVLFRYRVALVSYIVPAISNDTVNIVIKNDTSYVSTRLFAKNKSLIPLQIDSIKYKIGLFNKVYLEEEKYLGIRLKAYDSDTFDFSLKIPTGEILRDLEEIRKKTKKANYSIHVALQYSTMFGRIELPINKWSNFEIPTPPEIKAVQVNYTKIRPDYMLAEVKVKISNFNNISLTVETINYTLLVPGQGIAVGSYTTPVTISPQSEMVVYLPVKIKWFHIARTLVDLVQNEDIYNYILTCKALVTLQSENQKPLLVEITKLGQLELKKQVNHPRLTKLKKSLEKFFSDKKVKSP